VHRLVYRIALVLDQLMNATTKQIAQLRFKWHEASALLNADGQPERTAAIPKPDTTTHIVGGVHFIKDVNCESTLQAVRQALCQGVEFCVHSESVSTLIANRREHSFNTEEQSYLQCLSSGSNGKPKRIRRTQSSWINSFLVTKEQDDISSADSYAIIGRASHSLALYAALEAAWIGADVHALADLRPNKQLRAIAHLKSSVLYATPTQLRLLCSSVKPAVEKNTQLRYLFCGGGKLDEFTASLVANHFPNATVKEFYGASETSFITMGDNTTPIASVGKLYPQVKMKILPVDSNTHSADHLDNGCVGEIWIKSPYLFEQYCDGIEPDTRWYNGFLCIGEMGYIDDQANLYLTGRRSRMVNIADNMVFPEQIENLLNNHEAVRHCVVIATNDSKRGSVLIAVVEAVETQQLRAQLLKYCREELGALKAPRDITFVDSLPILASGKPDLQSVERQYEPT